MTNKQIVKRYLNKYFKSQYFNESDHEFQSLVRILNKKDKIIEQVKNDAEINDDMKHFKHQHWAENIHDVHTD